MPVPIVTANHEGVKLRRMRRQPCWFFGLLERALEGGWGLLASSTFGALDDVLGVWLLSKLRSAKVPLHVSSVRLFSGSALALAIESAGSMLKYIGVRSSSSNRTK